MKRTNPNHPIGRRNVLGAAAALSAGTLGSVTALGQTRDQVAKGEGNHSASNPGPINKVLTGESPDSYLPPTTGRGDVLPIWYSFDLVHRRIQDGGWTRQVTARELPSSQDVAGEEVGFLDAVPRPTEYPVGSYAFSFWNQRCHRIRVVSRGTATPECCGITRAV